MDVRPRPTASPPTRRWLTRNPPNAETPLAALAEVPTPEGCFYVRSHFATPALTAADWRLEVAGRVGQPRAWSLADLQALSQRSLLVTLECAGNGRSLMTPRPEGTPWGLGAVSTARFTGTPLREVLDRTGVRPEACEVVFVGADAGEVAPGRQEPYARALPLEAALHPDTLLVWAMNGRPLPPEHGYPLRLLVPGWYGMASVKWLARVEVVAKPFKGFFQQEHYVYRQAAEDPGEPVARARVRALIARPAEGERLATGAVEVAGTAWSGEGAVWSVVVSVDGGRTWEPAVLGAPQSPYAAVTWRWTWRPSRPGAHRLMARATDSAGHSQPLEPLWNVNGYGNNPVHAVEVTVV